MSKPTDFEEKTDLDLWWRVTKEVYGNDCVSKIIGTGIFQNGYEYAKEIKAYLKGNEVSKFVFVIPGEEIDYVEKAA